MKSHEGGIYCRICAGKLRSRLPDEFEMKDLILHEAGEGTCWGCGTTVLLHEAVKLVKKEEK